jgi:DNA-binding NarL/FixJ family response regulator
MGKMPSGPTERARLIIADDHELARAGLRSMLMGDPGLEIVGEAANGHDAIARCSELRPDLILLDVRMPELDGMAATRLIKQESPETSVLIVTMHETPEYLLEAMRAGAAGYVLKDATRAELLAAVRQVLRGEQVLNGALAARLLQRMVHTASPAGAQDGPRLTARELDVLRLLVQGKTNREIAAALTVSAGTVKIHVEHIIAKLAVSDRTQAAVRAVELGLIAPVRG